MRAESDLYFATIVKDGSLGNFLHRRVPAAIDNQTVIRLNRDTLYSAAVFDLGAGTVTITLPNAGKRFMSMQVIDEDQYTPQVNYGEGRYSLTMRKLALAISPWPCERWSTRPIPKMSRRFMPCRMRSRSISQGDRANSRCHLGT